MKDDYDHGSSKNPDVNELIVRQKVLIFSFINYSSNEKKFIKRK